METGQAWVLLALLWEGTAALLCACSYPQAKYCTASGLCDAEVDGEHLKTYLASTRPFLNASRQTGPVWEGVCKDLADDTHAAYFVLEDMASWTPVCASVDRVGTCSLAPAGSESLRQALLNKLIAAHFRRLGCVATGLRPALTKGDWSVCRQDRCNDRWARPTNTVLHNSSMDLATPDEAGGLAKAAGALGVVQEEAGAAESRREGAESLSDAAAGSEEWPEEGGLRNVLLYIVGPAALTIIILATLTVLICWRCRLWKFVYRLQDKDRSRLDSLYHSV